MTSNRYSELQEKAVQILRETTREVREVEGVLNNNWVFFTSDNRKPYMVKFIAAEEKSRLSVEVALYRCLQAKTDVPVPGVLQYAEDANGGAYVVREIVEGRNLKEELQSGQEPQGLFRQAGEILAKLHRIEFSQKGFLTADLQVEEYDLFSEVEYQHILAKLSEHGEISAAELERLQQVDVRFYFDRAPYVLCHCDYTWPNLIVQDGRIAAVIDFEWASAVPFMDDVATFDLVARLDGYAEALPHFYAGYQQIRPIPEYFFAQLEFYRFYRAITMLAYISGADADQFKGEFLQKVRREVRRVVELGGVFVVKE